MFLRKNEKKHLPDTHSYLDVCGFQFISKFIVFCLTCRFGYFVSECFVFVKIVNIFFFFCFIEQPSSFFN